MSRPLLIAGAVLMIAGLLCWVIGLDDTLHTFLRLSVASPLRGAVLRITFVGSLLVMGPAAMLVAVALLLRGRQADALWLFGSILLGRLAVEALKLAIMRPRPPQADRLDVVTSWSFPSSHSAGAMLTCVALALLVRRPIALVTAMAFAALIGWSRLALGVHWPGDVLAGWGFALAWLGLASRFLPYSAATNSASLRTG